MAPPPRALLRRRARQEREAAGDESADAGVPDLRTPGASSETAPRRAEPSGSLLSKRLLAAAAAHSAAAPAPAAGVGVGVGVGVGGGAGAGGAGLAEEVRVLGDKVRGIEAQLSGLGRVRPATLAPADPRPPTPTHRAPRSEAGPGA